ncbi:VPS10 domain-containing receptor SorCS1-like [Clavelina lepadiformis]|uniref:VPS10 domain-containing receptor SorCS1-like n=1 Tax=Clavelina lepadiformis TaxID=159417 RepID=UPI004042DF3F
MNLLTRTIFILICVASCTPRFEGRMFSSTQIESRERKQPTLISSTDDDHHEASVRYQRFLHSRRRRSQPINTASEDSFVSKPFSLGNYTNHNQALIHWSGKNSKVIFILTRTKGSDRGGRVSNSSLWRSVDYGNNYSEERSKFNKTDVILKSYFICPTNKSKIMFAESHKSVNRVWVSRDEGDTYRSFEVNFALEKVEFHPSKQDWVLGYDKEATSLYVSQDLGETWTLLHEGVTSDRYFWYIKDVDIVPRAEEIVHFEYRNLEIFPEKVYLIKSCYINNCEPTPFQQHCDDVGAIDKESLVVQDNYVFVQKPGAREKMFVSYMRRSFTRAQFPGHHEQTEFHIISSDSGTVIAGVNHKNAKTTLYTSDVEGKKFALSLANVRYFDRKTGDDMVFSVDIHEVKSVSGTFIANTMTSNSFNVTMITWDNGRSWSHLKYEASDQPSNCANCHLNLHCLMTKTRSGYFIPLMLSKDSIPGLIISHGSIGTTLANLPTRVSVYVSENAGVTWKKVLERRHLFAFGDHGAMLVAVEMVFLRPVQDLYFSSDVGINWTKHQFSKTPINVDGLLTEPGEYTHKFTLFGHKHYTDPWKLFALDFKPLVQGNCNYPHDYTNWTMQVPSSSNQVSQCHLGMVQVFEKIKTPKCLIGPEYKRYTSKEPCHCTELDYECDYGYVLQMTGDCVNSNPKIDAIGDVYEDEDDLIYGTADDVSPCVNGMRNVSSGWRRIPGDNCIIDLSDKLFKLVPCSSTTVSPATPTSKIEIHLLNNTNVVKMGQRLAFTAMLSGLSKVQWLVKHVSQMNTSGPGSRFVKLVGPNNTILVQPAHPGTYQVLAFDPNDSSVADFMFVSFWYPLEEVEIIHPPVVEVKRQYNATAIVLTKYGLRSQKSFVGDIDYVWKMDSKNFLQLRSTNFIALQHTQAGNYHIAVTTTNAISYVKGSGNVAVKDYVEIIVLPLLPSRPVTDSMITHDWLRDVRELLIGKIFDIPAMALVLTSRSLIHEHNFHVYVEPILPLKAKLILSPKQNGIPTSSQLLEAATSLQKLIAEKPFTFTVDRNLVITVGEPVVRNDEGKELYVGGGVSAGIIVLIVLIVLLVVVGGIFIVRHYAKNARWKAYFTMRNTGNISLRSSHIVRPRPNDCAPIVDDEEFIDDDLDNMETISSPQDGTLQFRG